MKQSGAQILIKCLEEEKVRAIFGYPGGAVLDIYDALYDSSLKHFLVRHEQGAAHAADGYARATGKPGVCLATSGPGATKPGYRPGKRLHGFYPHGRLLPARWPRI